MLKHHQFFIPSGTPVIPGSAAISFLSEVPEARSTTQCLKTQKEDKKIADGWNVDFLYYYDIF